MHKRCGKDTKFNMNTQFLLEEMSFIDTYFSCNHFSWKAMHIITDSQYQTSLWFGDVWSQAVNGKGIVLEPNNIPVLAPERLIC